MQRWVPSVEGELGNMLNNDFEVKYTAHHPAIQYPFAV